MKLSPKYKRFLKHNKATVEVLEGTTSAGKTTVGMVKFMLKIAKSELTEHIIACENVGIAEKNIINADLGILDIFGDYVQYNENGKGKVRLPHIIYTLDNGTKHTIYIVGYDNAKKWKYALGGQYGCVFIDEVNTANIDFVREVSIRYRYLMLTLNPDDPELPVYKEYINHARPIDECPEYMQEYLNEEAYDNWVYWFFDFYDNAGLTEERIEQIKKSAPPGSRLYKTKIEGIRTKGVGIVLELPKENIITPDKAKTYTYKRYTFGVDTSYSTQSPDEFTFVFTGITNQGKVVALKTSGFNNKDKHIAPSDIPLLFGTFYEECRQEYGFTRDVFVDNADQATIMEMKKYRNKIYQVISSYKKMKIIDRVNAETGWVANGHLEVVNTCKGLIKDFNNRAWEKDAPEDRNNHFWDAFDYSWVAYKHEIGMR